MERITIDKIERTAQEERQKVRKEQIEAEAEAIEKIRREASEEESRIEREYQNAIQMVKEGTALPASALTDTETDNNKEEDIVMEEAVSTFFFANSS